MAKRFTFSLSLIFLLVFAQISAFEHAISHIHTPAEQTLPDDDAPTAQCDICIAFSNVTNSANQSNFIAPLIHTVDTFTVTFQIQAVTQYHLSRFARAPPSTFVS